MNEAELSEYCRSKGLYPEQVKQWQDICQQANGENSANLIEVMKREKDLEKRLRQVIKDLQRKESALAETAALLVLSKVGYLL
jgi:transposase